MSSAVASKRLSERLARNRAPWIFERPRRQIDPRQQLLFESFWLDRPKRSATEVLADLRNELEIPDWQLPELVETGRPARDPAEVIAMTEYFGRVAEIRRLCLNAFHTAFALDALGVELSQDTSLAPLRRSLLHGSYDAPAVTSPLRYSSSTHVQPFTDLVDDAFAKTVIEDTLFPGKDRVLDRFRTDEVKRRFIDEELPELLRLYGQLRGWVKENSRLMANRAQSMEEVDQSLAGILSETTLFVFHSINAYLDAVLIDLPNQLSEAELRNRKAQLSSVEVHERCIRGNYVSLFLAPAGLTPTKHRALWDEKGAAGNANPIRRGLLRVLVNDERDYWQRPFKAVWDFRKEQTGFDSKDMELALRYGSKCGGLPDFLACDDRSSAIIFEATGKLPDGHNHRDRINPIAIVVLLTCRKLYALYPQLVRRAPWILPNFEESRYEDWAQLAQPPHSQWAVPPPVVWPERVTLNADDHNPRRLFRGLYLKRWRGEELASWARQIVRDTEEYGEDWLPEWLRRVDTAAEAQSRLQRLLDSARAYGEGAALFGLHYGHGAPLGLFLLGRVSEAWIFPEVRAWQAERALMKAESVARTVLGYEPPKLSVSERDERLRGWSICA